MTRSLSSKGVHRRCHDKLQGTCPQKCHDKNTSMPIKGVHTNWHDKRPKHVFQKVSTQGVMISMATTFSNIFYLKKVNNTLLRCIWEKLVSILFLAYNTQFGQESF